MKRIVGLLVAACLALGGIVSATRAQDTNYPTHPIRVIVPYPAGGLVDLITRVVTERLAQNLGQQFIIESRAGANGTIATASVAHADPDGYTARKLLSCAAPARLRKRRPGRRSGRSSPTDEACARAPPHRTRAACRRPRPRG